MVQLKEKQYLYHEDPIKRGICLIWKRNQGTKYPYPGGPKSPKQNKFRHTPQDILYSNC